MSEANQAEVQIKIVKACESLKEILLGKNAAYGNSVMDPIRVFSDAEPWEQILVRLDDKLTRIKRGKTYGQEDTVFDLLGYLLFLWISLKEHRDSGKTESTPAKVEAQTLFQLMTGQYVYRFEGTEARTLLAILAGELSEKTTVQSAHVDPVLATIVVQIRSLLSKVKNAEFRDNEGNERLRDSLFQIRAIVNRAEATGGGLGELKRWLQMAGEGDVPRGAELQDAERRVDKLLEKLADVGDLLKEKEDRIKELEALEQIRDQHAEEYKEKIARLEADLRELAGV